MWTVGWRKLEGKELEKCQRKCVRLVARSVLEAYQESMQREGVSLNGVYIN